MRRTTALCTCLLAGLAPVLLVLTQPATAAAETCRGEAATIVGTGGDDIVGTEGRDVVVTNRSQEVRTLGGDDLVCVTGRGHFSVELDTGPGNDVVDGTAAPSLPVAGHLGSGSDRFEGGAGADRVDGGTYAPDGGADDAPDVLLGGGGDDSLFSGQPGLDNADVLDGGSGDDHFSVLGRQAPGAELAGGEGTDALGLELGAGQHVVDNVAGRLTSAGTVHLTWTGLESFSSSSPDGVTAEVRFLGGPADELLQYYGTGVVVAMAGDGDDQVELEQVPPPDSRLDGGAGQDRLSTGSADQDLAWDLKGPGIMVDGRRLLPATAFEDAFLAAPRVRLRGTDGDNALEMSACNATARGRGGDDFIRLTFDIVFESYPSCAERTTLVGGAGDDHLRSRSAAQDTMVGGPGADVFEAKGGRDRLLGGPGHDRAEAGSGPDTFLGGPGRDRVDGDRGRDRCQAEREERCER